MWFNVSVVCDCMSIVECSPITLELLPRLRQAQRRREPKVNFLASLCALPVHCDTEEMLFEVT